MLPRAIRVAHVEVRRDRIVASVVVGEERFAVTTPELISLLLPRYPHLMEHSCVNGRGTTFAAVAANTSTPHLLEHMAIENQALGNTGRPLSGLIASPLLEGRAAGLFVGKTQWADRTARIARVEFSYVDDLAALAALRDAARDLDGALRLLAPSSADSPSIRY